MPVTASRDEALDLLERVRREYVATARAAAVVLFLMERQPITVDDVRSVCPPPDGIDGRVMGAILRAPQWTQVGYTRSHRRTCHKRPISKFVWTGDRADTAPSAAGAAA